MTLLWFLIFANILGGIIAAWSFISSRTPEMGKFSSLIMKIKLPVGVLVLLISLINIFNFWADHYPKLTLLTGLLLGIILSIDLIKNITMDENIKKKIISIAQNIQIIVGLMGLVIGIIWLLYWISRGIVYIL